MSCVTLTGSVLWCQMEARSGVTFMTVAGSRGVVPGGGQKWKCTMHVIDREVCSARWRPEVEVCPKEGMHRA